MKPLRQAIDDYISLRRSLGFKLRRMSEGLREFAAFLEQRAAPVSTTASGMTGFVLEKRRGEESPAPCPDVEPHGQKALCLC
jgi:hypothetical protein